MQQTCLIIYHSADHNVCETTLNTLRKVSSCKIIIFTDGLASEITTRWQRLYNVEFVGIPDMAGRRALAKCLTVHKYIIEHKADEQILISDADIYYLQDPFSAFKGNGWDIGLPQRFIKRLGINGGMWFARPSDKLKAYLEHANRELQTPSDPYWQCYLQGLRRRGIVDWWIDQDWLNFIYSDQENIKNKWGVTIGDVPPEYNYSRFLDTPKDSKAAANAILKWEHVAVHLKGTIKQIIYTENLPLAITCHERFTKKDWL